MSITIVLALITGVSALISLASAAVAVYVCLKIKPLDDEDRRQNARLKALEDSHIHKEDYRKDQEDVMTSLADAATLSQSTMKNTIHSYMDRLKEKLEAKYVQKEPHDKHCKAQTALCTQRLQAVEDTLKDITTVEPRR